MKDRSNDTNDIFCDKKTFKKSSQIFNDATSHNELVPKGSENTCGLSSIRSALSRKGNCLEFAVRKNHLKY